MAIRASTEVGPLRVSVGAPSRPKRRALATGLKLPRKAELPPPVAPAGWYRDPEDGTRMRWWSGAKWTRRFAEPRAVKPSAPSVPKVGKRAAQVTARVAVEPPRVTPRKPAVKKGPRGLIPNVAFAAGTRRSIGSYRRKNRNSEPT